MRAAAWTDDEIEILRATYADDTIARPFQRACELLPNRTPNTISYHASTCGFSAARAARFGQAVRARGVGGRVPRDPAKVAERERIKAEAKAQRTAERARAKAQRKRDRQRAAAQKREDAEKAKRVAAATKAANVAAAAVAEADRLAALAGIPPMIVAGRPARAQSLPEKLRAIGEPSVDGYARIPCDAGEREIIRRRLVHTINALAAELGRDPKSVAAAVARVSASGFKRENMMFTVVADEIDPGASVMNSTLRGVFS